MHICQLTPEGVYAGTAIAVTEFDGCPPGWVRAEPPEGEGPFMWAGDRWAEIEAAPVQALALARLKVALRAALADYRWRKTQTFNFDGEVDVPADPALSVITSIAVADSIVSSGGATRTFKLKPGAFRQWTVDQIVTYGMAIGTYVQACFDREAEIDSEIGDAETAGALDAIDIESGWPT